MRHSNIVNHITRATGLGAIAAGALLASQAALACQTTAWSDTFGSVAAGDPAADGIARYQGLCGLEASGQGYVQDNSPAGIDRIVARFYVLNGNTAEATIYRGFSATDGTGELFNVTLDDAGGVTFTDVATGQSVSQSGSTNWLSVEIDWVRDANGSISLSVNGQTPAEVTGIDTSGAAQLASVRLGNLDGAAGSLGFDSYESRRSTAVGRLLACNAQASDEEVNILDALAVVNENNEAGLATGTPDCDENGEIDILDVLAIVNIINS